MKQALALVDVQVLDHTVSAQTVLAKRGLMQDLQRYGLELASALVVVTIGYLARVGQKLDKRR